MTVKKRRKNSRQRGHHTHGWGAKKKHRGSGNKGGFGMAGTGKRADQKKPTIINEYGNDYYGKHGFNRPQKILEKVKAINLDNLQSKLHKFMDKKLVTKDGDFYVVDADKLGYQKILGGGNLSVKLKIKEHGGIVEAEDVLDK